MLNLRPGHTTHPLRRQRDELLCPVSNQRKGPRRPKPVPPPRRILAPHPRRTGSTKNAISLFAFASAFPFYLSVFPFAIPCVRFLPFLLSCPSPLYRSL